MTIGSWPASPSPGAEQRNRWGSASADLHGSYNLTGAASPAIDAMISAMLVARELDDFVAAVRALDDPAVRLLHRAALLCAGPMDRLFLAPGPTRPDAPVRGQFRRLVESRAMNAGPDPAGALSELLRAAGAARPDAIFARIGGGASDAPAALRAGAIDALADHYAARLAEADLPSGARLLLLSPPEPRTLSAIVGALRAGFDVALAPPSLDIASIAAVAEAFGASAMAGPTEFAELRTGERIFEAAALVDDPAGRAARSGGSGRARAGRAAGGRRPERGADARAPVVRRRHRRCGAQMPIDFAGARTRRRARIRGARRGARRRGDRLDDFARIGGGPRRRRLRAFDQRRASDLAGAVRGAAVPRDAGDLRARASHCAGRSGGGSRRRRILTADRLSSLTLAAVDAAPPPTFTHGVDPARVFVLRSGADAGLRLEAIGERAFGAN